jgi:hypothetical protein
MKEGVCMYFNGSLANDYCNAGVNYREFVGGPDPGWARRTPCIKRHGVDGCNSYREPTAEEIKADEEAFEKSFAGMQKAIATIMEKTKANPDFEPGMDVKKQGSGGEIDCPLCGGTLHYIVSAGNHHIHGKCETTGCLTWMM